MMQLLWLGAMISTGAQWLDYPLGSQLGAIGYIVIVCSLLGAIINRLERTSNGYSFNTTGGQGGGSAPVPTTLYKRDPGCDPDPNPVLKGPWNE